MTEPVSYREALEQARDELQRWGWGDLHYGNQPQERSVVEAIAKIDAALASTEPTPADVENESIQEVRNQAIRMAHDRLRVEGVATVEHRQVTAGIDAALICFGTLVKAGLLEAPSAPSPEPGLMVPAELVEKEAARCRRFTPDDALLTPEARAAAVAMAVSEAVILDSLIVSAVPCRESAKPSPHHDHEVDACPGCALRADQHSESVRRLHALLAEHEAVGQSTGPGWLAGVRTAHDVARTALSQQHMESGDG